MKIFILYLLLILIPTISMADTPTTTFNVEVDNADVPDLIKSICAKDAVRICTEETAHQAFVNDLLIQLHNYRLTKEKVKEGVIK